MNARYCFVLFLLTAGSVLQAQEPVLKLPTAHTAWITQFALSHNGKWAATASYDNTIKIWDLRTRRELKVLQGHRQPVNAIRFSPNDSLLLSGGVDMDLRLWNVQQGVCVRRLDTLFDRIITDVDFSPDGRLVAGCSSNSIVVYELAGGRRELFAGLSGRGLRLRFFPDGTKIACAQADSLLSVWRLGDSADYVERESFYYRHGRINDFLFTKSGLLLAAVDAPVDNVRLHRMGALDSFRFAGHPMPALGVSAGENDDVFYSMSRDASTSRLRPTIEIRKWRIGRRTPIDSFVLRDRANTAPLFQLALDRQGRIAYGNSSAVLFARPTGAHLQEQISSHTSIVNSIRLSGNQLLTASEDGLLHFMDLKTGRLEVEDLGSRIICSRLSTDRRLLYLVLRQHTDSGYHSFIVRFDPERRRRDTLVREWNATIRGIPGLTISADGARIAYTVMPVTPGGVDNSKARFRIWDGQQKKCSYESKAGQIWGLTFLRDRTDFALTSGLSNILFLVKGDHTVRLQDSVRAAGNTYYDVAQLDAQRVLVAYEQGVQVWNIASGVLERKIAAFAGPPGYVSLELLAGDSAVLLTKDDSVRVVQLSTGALSKPVVSDLGWFNYATMGDSGQLVTAGIDNSIRFWDTAQGQERFRLVYIDSAEHLFFTPAGYYQSSRAAAQQVHYATADMRVITFEQLDVQRNRPDLVLRAVGAADPALVDAYHKAWAKRVRRLGFDTAVTNSQLSVPEADFADRDSIAPVQRNRQLLLRIRAQDKEQPLGRLNLWVNECPLFGTRGLALPQGRRTLDTTLAITLSAGTNVLETSVLNAVGTESYRSPLTVHCSAASDSGRLHFIGIGIDSFADNRFNLRYSVKDLRDLATALSRRYRGRIRIDTLFNSQVNVEAVQALKKRLLEGSVDDKVILSYSGHGLLDKDLNYFLSTYRVRFDAPEKNGLPYEALEALLDSIPARRKLLLIDACHSGEVDKEDVLRFDSTAKGLPAKGTKGVVLPKAGPSRMGMKNSFELMQELFVDVGRRTGATVISAAAGTQLAHEGGSVQNGVFTYAILEFLKRSPSGSVNDLKQYVNRRVKELTKGLQVPTSRAENKLLNWQIW